MAASPPATSREVRNRDPKGAVRPNPLRPPNVSLPYVRPPNVRTATGRKRHVPIRTGPPRQRATLRALSEPLAYFITFRTYGTFLHGDDRGSIDRDHNTLDGPRVPPDPAWVEQSRMRMKAPPLILSRGQRQTCDASIRERCEHAGWALHAVNVRTNHVHVVVSASESPEQVMTSLKAWCTRGLRSAGLPPNQAVWARHGSTRRLWDEDAVGAAVVYVRDLQDDPERWAKWG